MTELVSNAFKYAFPGGREGIVDIRLAEKGDQYELSVRDDGVGHENALGDKPRSGLGFELVEALAQQLGGRVYKASDGGTEVTLRFPR